MQQWLATNGVLVRMEAAQVGATYLWLSTNSETSAVIEWSYLSDSLQVSVVHGDYLCVAEWAKIQGFLGRRAMDEHILMALRQWQEPYTDASLKQSESMKRRLSVLMLGELLDALDMPAEQGRPS